MTGFGLPGFPDFGQGFSTKLHQPSLVRVQRQSVPLKSLFQHVEGQVISPLLANIYLHYALDEWLETVVKPRLKGEAYEVRFADDFILCCQYREDAEKALDVLKKRFAKYGLPVQ